MVAEVLFPNTVPPFFPTGAVIARPPSSKTFPHRLAGIRAHNRWLADFCGEAPGRRAGVAQIFLNDVDEAVADVRWAKEHGLASVLLPGRPDDTDLPPLYDPGYDPLWSVCEDLDLPVTHHSGQGSPDYGKSAAAGVMWIVETTWFSHRPLWQLIMGGVFERHPGLRFVLTESGCSWIPDTLRMLDGFHREMASGRIGELKYTDDERLRLQPSEYFARNCHVGVSFPSPTEARAMRTVGLDRVMWGSDYPHHESTYPHTTEGLRRAFAGCGSRRGAAGDERERGAPLTGSTSPRSPRSARVGPGSTRWRSRSTRCRPTRRARPSLAGRSPRSSRVLVAQLRLDDLPGGGARGMSSRTSSCSGTFWVMSPAWRQNSVSSSKSSGSAPATRVTTAQARSPTPDRGGRSRPRPGPSGASRAGPRSPWR